MSFFKSPKYINEKKQYFAALDQDADIAVRVRAKRTPSNIADEDDERMKHRDRSWKIHRKTQWKGKSKILNQRYFLSAGYVDYTDFLNKNENIITPAPSSLKITKTFMLVDSAKIEYLKL